MSATAAAPVTTATGGRFLEWFEPAVQIGMTATPRREDNVDTYDYFGQWNIDVKTHQQGDADRMVIER